MKAVYGPVSSWRLGRSLGIDPICRDQKACSFDCVYCQLGKGEKIHERREFITLKKLKEDLDIIKDVKADVITFSGTGEATLAKNLKPMVDYVKSISELPLAIITNSSLLSDREVRNILYKFDIVVAKLDVPNEKLFLDTNRPHEKIKFKKYMDGIKRFREKYPGKFALQIMFIGLNKDYAKEIAKIAKELKPNEIQVNTPLRPCAVKALNKKEIREIKEIFNDFKNVICVYEAEKPWVNSINLGEVKKRKRPKP